MPSEIQVFIYMSVFAASCLYVRHWLKGAQAEVNALAVCWMRIIITP